MSLSGLRGTCALAVLLALVVTRPAGAQVEPPRPVEELEEQPQRRAPPPVPKRRPTPPAPETVPAQRAPPSRTAEPPRAAEPAASGGAAARPLPPLLVPTAGDPELMSAFRRWQQAEREGATRVAEAARNELLALREELGISDLESMSIAMLRAAADRRKREDLRGSTELAAAAAALSPTVPYVYLGLAQAQLAEESFAWRRVAVSLQSAARAFFRDPRYARAALGDFGTALAFAWVATALAAMAVLLLRHLRALFHDVHHLLPRAVSRWQSAALLLLLLVLPLVFHLGLVVELLVILAALTLYLSDAERVVTVVLIAGLGAVPLAAARLASATAFAGTPAEDAYLLERGGLEAANAAARIRSRGSTDQRSAFGELYALGRFEARRGHLPEASVAFTAASTLRPNDARLLTQAGNIAFAENKLDRAAELYQRATEADPTLPEAYWNAAKLHRRRARMLSDDAVGPELDRAQTALASATRLDERLAQRQDPPDDKPSMNRLLLSPALARSELDSLADVPGRAARVRSQASAALLGGLDGTAGLIVPLVVAALLVGFGFLRNGRGVSHACDKCGRPVCRRCDPQLSVGSPFCPQCVNVFARRGIVPPLLKVNKEMEVRRHRTRTSRIAYTLGVLCSGLGHVFSGAPLRGVGYAFLFLFAAACVVTREGVLRAPYGPVPEALRILPVAVLVAAVTFLSLRGLSRKT